MKLLVKKDTTNNTWLIFVQDSSSTTGDGLTGVTASMLTAYYARVEDDNDVTTDSIVIVDIVGTGTVHTDGGWEEINPNMPGWYRFDPPDAVVATGASSVGVSLIDSGANNIAQVTIEIQLVDFDPNDGVRLALTAMPNAAADAAGGLPISDTGGLDLDTQLAATNEVTAARMGALTDWIDGGRLDLLIDAIPTTAMRGTDSAGTAAELAKVPKSDSTVSWNATALAAIQSECDGALVGQKLDHLVAVADADDVVDDSIIAKMVSSAATANWSDFVNTTDSLQAIRDRGDAAWTTGAGSGLTPLASGTAQGGDANTIQLASGETFADDELIGNSVKITSGTGAGQSRVITDSVGSTDTATITPVWATQPDATSVYEIVNASVNLVLIENSDATNQIRDSLVDDATRFSGADIATILVDTGTTLDEHLTDIKGTGFIKNTNSLINAALASACTEARLAELDAANIPADIDAILVDTAEIGAAGAGLSAIPKTGYILASTGLDSVVVETGVNARQALSIIASSATGVLAGAATTTVTIAAADNSGTNRVSATVDADGNRSAVTLSLPA